MLFIQRFRRWRMAQARNIFVYYDGIRWRYADPLVLDVKRTEVCKDWATMVEFLTIPVIEGHELPPEAMRQVNENKAKAIRTLADAAVGIFDLHILDDKTGIGLTGGEVLDVFASYVNFETELAIAALPLLNSPARAGASPPASARAEHGETATEPSAASTSGAGESPRSKEESSQQASVS